MQSCMIYILHMYTCMYVKLFGTYIIAHSPEDVLRGRFKSGWGALLLTVSLYTAQQLPSRGPLYDAEIPVHSN